MVAIKHRWVVGYEGQYSIGTDGNVLSHKYLGHTGRKGFLTIQRKENYPYVKLIKDGKQTHKDIHRLLAEAFIENPKNLDVVKHLNHNKHDYRLVNLQWGTYQENSEDSLAKDYLLTSPTGELVRVYNMRKFCREEGLDQRCMNLVASGRNISHGGWIIG